EPHCRHDDAAAADLGAGVHHLAAAPAGDRARGARGARLPGRGAGAEQPAPAGPLAAAPDRGVRRRRGGGRGGRLRQAAGGRRGYGEVLFWMHMVRHLMLIMIAPWLLALGRPVTLLLRVTRRGTHRRVRAVLRSAPVAVLTYPLVTTAGYILVVVGVHLSGFMQAMMDHPALGWLENAGYLVAGYLFFPQTLADEPSRWDLPYPLRLFLQFVAMSADTIVGVILLQTPTVPWSSYAHPHRTW